MTTANPASPASSLHRAALLDGVLAVIAGFLGMHIPTGSLGMHCRAVMPAAVAVGGSQVPPWRLCQGGCAEKPAAHVDCTPTPAGSSLSAPPPGTTLLAMQSWTAALAGRQPDYAYLPGTPSPRDLSISRT